MQKINFTDTTITQKPYVTVNNQNYEVQDGIYTGGTDLNAQTFNDMQANIETAINALYPIGHIIIRDTDEDMSNFLGFTWQKVFAGKILIGVDGSDDDFKVIGNTGGEKTHTLSIDEMPKHNHGVSFSAGVGLYNTAVRGNGENQEMGNAITTVSESGGGQAHNNMPPYQVVAYWKRIA